MVLRHDPLKEDVTDPFEKFSDDDYPAISRDIFDKLNRTMGATNTMALYTTALLGYISFLPSSPVITLATPSLASQEDNSDLDDTIPNLVNIESAASSPKDNSEPTYTNFNDDFLHDLHQRSAPPPAPSCTISGGPVVDSAITHSHTLPSSLAVSSFPNSPNNLFTLSDLKHRNLDYIQADSTIYANDSTWRWWNDLVKHQGAIPKARRGAMKDSCQEVKRSFEMKEMGRRYDLVPTTKPAERSVALRVARTTRRCDDQ
ncbi:hypothetical protein D6C95_07517 [Aureobasidium pullulans]|nr:hypothetical protein D6C95_07517 [Aureobasidium pullulans]